MALSLIFAIKMGALQASDLDDLIAQAKALDLAAAKAQQAAQEQQ